MKSPDDLVEVLRDRATQGATMVDLVDTIHSFEQAPHYSTGLVRFWFSRAFRLSVFDFADIVFACELFGHGATVTIAETEERFRKRLFELGFEGLASSCDVGRPEPASS